MPHKNDVSAGTTNIPHTSSQIHLTHKRKGGRAQFRKCEKSSGWEPFCCLPPFEWRMFDQHHSIIYIHPLKWPRKSSHFQHLTQAITCLWNGSQNDNPLHSRFMRVFKYLNGGFFFPKAMKQVFSISRCIIFGVHGNPNWRIANDYVVYVVYRKMIISK